MRRTKSLSLMTYLKMRKSTVLFLVFLILGVIGSSQFCITGSESAVLLHSIFLNDFSQKVTRGFFQVFFTNVWSFFSVFLYIYLCLNSRKGQILIYAIPFVHGLSIGAQITTLLLSKGNRILFFIIFTIFLPKLIETLLLLSLCNKTARFCSEEYSDQVRHHKSSNDSIPLFFYVLLFTAYFALESLLLLFFRGLYF